MTSREGLVANTRPRVAIPLDQKGRMPARRPREVRRHLCHCAQNLFEKRAVKTVRLAGAHHRRTRTGLRHLLLSFLTHGLATEAFDLLQVPPDILNPDEPEHRRWAASPLVKFRSVQHLQRGSGEPRGC